jgi:NADH-quinone oxidoreductase subunit N
MPATAPEILWIAPEILLTVFAAGLLLWEAFSKPCPRLVGFITLGGLILTALITLWIPVTRAEGSNVYFAYYWSNLYAWDYAAKFFKVFFIATAAIVTWMSIAADEESLPARGEFFIFPLLTTAGLCLLASVTDFMVLFVALELVTISFYILVAYQRSNSFALEAGVKYLILGALSSAFLVMGIAYVFGITGSTHFREINTAIAHGGVSTGLKFGLLLVIVGLGFKVAAVPFHFWAPDVYQGAPTPITAFLAVGSKAAGFVLLMRVLYIAFAVGGLSSTWELVLGVLAGLSMILGNLAAIPQRDIKRMLAYSSIGHSGFMLIGVIAQANIAVVLIYLVSYLLANLVAFLVITVVSRTVKGEQIHQYAGLWQRSPVLAGTLAVALVSLGGIPPTVGFIAKLSIFAAAWSRGYYCLFAIGVITAVAGLYYYLGVVKAMFWSEPLDNTPVPAAFCTKALLLVLTAVTILFGFWPQGLELLVQFVQK